MKTKIKAAATETFKIQLSWGFDSECIELESKLQKANAGDHFKLCLLDSSRVSLDSVLAFYEIVTTRPKGVGLHIHSYSSLTDANVLIWLAGETRTLRRGAWILFREYAKEQAKRSDYQRFLDSLEERNCATGLSAGEENYAQVERLVKKQLPLHLLNRRVWEGELAEWDVVNPAAPEIKSKQRKTPVTKSDTKSDSTKVLECSEDKVQSLDSKKPI